MIAKYGPVGLRLSTSGRPAASTYVQVVYRDTVTDAVLYTDGTGDELADNPVLTDSSGNLSFWAEAGPYDILVNGARIAVEVLATVGGGAARFSFRQAAPAASWAVTHNLGSRDLPTVLLDDEPERPVYTDVEIVDENTQVITFPEPASGWAHFH